jgi:predicted esterase
MYRPTILVAIAAWLSFALSAGPSMRAFDADCGCVPTLRAAASARSGSIGAGRVSRGADSLPGRMVARATSGPDTTQTFAIYFPSAYSVERRWPAIFVMDPRGRGRQGAELFARSAERYGFVVISSYNTLSDGAMEPNVGAINAMLSEAQSSLSVDMSRLYIAGLSGTARIGWSFATEAPQNFAGLLAASAAPALNDAELKSVFGGKGFALALSAGSADFNWTEVRRADQQLLAARVPAHVDYFAGAHAWPPLPLIDRAVAWFKLRGMLDGRWSTDTAWLDEQIREQMLSADSLERQGHVAAAADAFAQLSVGLKSRPEAAEATLRSRALDARPDVRAIRRREDQLAAEELSRAVKLSQVLVEIRRGDPSVDAGELVRRHEFPRLKRLAAEGDSLERPFASRVLAFAAVSLGFYEPQRYLELGQPGRAVTALKVLAGISPWNAQQCAILARARALMTEAERQSVPSCSPGRP